MNRPKYSTPLVLSIHGEPLPSAHHGSAQSLEFINLTLGNINHHQSFHNINCHHLLLAEVAGAQLYQPLDPPHDVFGTWEPSGNGLGTPGTPPKKTPWEPPGLDMEAAAGHGSIHGPMPPVPPVPGVEGRSVEGGTARGPGGWLNG